MIPRVSWFVKRFLKKFFEGGGFSFGKAAVYISAYKAGKESAMDWKAMKAEYIAGGTSYRKLAEKYGESLSNIKRVAKNENWVELKNQCKAKAATKIVELESDRQAERMRRLLDVSDDLLNVVEDAVKKISLGELVVEKGVLKSISGTIKDIKEIQNIKTQLDIEEQKARIAILKKQAEHDDTASSVTVTIAGGEDSWRM